MQRRGLPAPVFEAGVALLLRWTNAQGQLALEVHGKVRDSDEQGTRLHLEDDSVAAVPTIQALIKQTEQAAATRSHAAPVANEKLGRHLELVREQIRQGLGPRIRRLLVQAETGLDQIALGTMVEIAGIPARMALEQLHAARSAVANRFLELLLGPWETGSAGLPARDRSIASLQLLDDDSTQTFLKRSESARKLERVTQKAWHDLRRLLVTLTTGSNHLDADALGVESLLDALTTAAREGGLEPGMQQFLLRLAGHPEVLDLGSFYQTLELQLERAGVEAPEAAAAAGPTAAAAAGADGGSFRRTDPQPNTAASSPRSGPAPATRAAMHAQPRLRPAMPAPTPASAISTARAIWSLGQPAAAPNPDLPRAPVLSDTALLDALREMIARGMSGANAIDFSVQLQEQAALLCGHPDARAEDRQLEAVDLMARLQQAIERDPLLPQTFRNWCRPLLAPILATQLHPDGLAESGEALRELFALLEFGSVLCTERNDPAIRQIGESISELVGQLQQSERLTPEQLKGACEQLEALLRRHRKAGHAIEERVVDSCVGQQRLVEARRQVQRELAVRFGGREIPEALAGLIGQRLAATMLLTLLREGTESQEWQSLKKRIEGLDHALRLAAEGAPVADAEPHIAWLRESHLADGADASALSGQMAALADSLRGKSTQWVPYHSPAMDHLTETSRPPGEDSEPSPVHKQLAGLQSGDWLAFGADQHNARLLKLAWMAPDRSRFVFVNQLGHRADDLRREELATVLRAGRARVVDQGDASVIERAWRSMMEDMHNQLAEQAIHDSLTGLLNRKELDRRLIAWTTAPERPPLTILWLGVDHLRVINQSHGMAAGDLALRAVADTLQRYSDRVPSGHSYCARIAGDEFAVVLEGVGPTASRRNAQALLDQLNALDLSLEGSSIRMTVSMGLVVAEDSCTSPDRLLADAERACRAAKDSGRGRLYTHQADDTLLSQMRESLDWVGRVESSLKTQSLMLYGQRAVSLSARAQADPDYLEILLRMRTDDGVALPGDFIIAAERYGQIMTLDRFVLQELTRSLRDAKSQHAFRIAFNVSARNIVDPEFIDEILETLQQQPMPMSQLCIELTETAAIAQLAEATVGMQRLADSGLSMVLDDFGSGWSSYQYLRRLPFDVVKVDGAFIKDIAHSVEDRAMARSINEIAHLLGKRTVAEHVEDAETLEQVREIGFDYAQGFFVGRPAPLGDFLD
ncbi:MAG: DUF1631 family protein [Lysobacterales bacterium]